MFTKVRTLLFSLAGVMLNDCTITGSSQSLVQSYKNKMNEKYLLTDFGAATWNLLLEIKITRDLDARAISSPQCPYIKSTSILHVFNFTDLKLFRVAAAWIVSIQLVHCVATHPGIQSLSRRIFLYSKHLFFGLIFALWVSTIPVFFDASSSASIANFLFGDSGFLIASSCDADLCRIQQRSSHAQFGHSQALPQCLKSCFLWLESGTKPLQRFNDRLVIEFFKRLLRGFNVRSARIFRFFRMGLILCK